MNPTPLSLQQLQNVVLIKQGSMKTLETLLVRNKTLLARKTSLNQDTADLEKHIQEIEDLLHRTQCSYSVSRSKLDILAQELGLTKEW